MNDSLNTAAPAAAARAIALACLAVLPACTATRDAQASVQEAAARTAAVERELFTADEAFAEDTAKRGLPGWLSWYADDAVRMAIDGFVARGQQAIAVHDGPLFEDATLALRWQPTDAGADPDGNHGWTRGAYQVLRMTDGDPPRIVSTGHYLTVWRREAGGWKVVLDTGVPDETPAH